MSPQSRSFKCQVTNLWNLFNTAYISVSRTPRSKMKDLIIPAHYDHPSLPPGVPRRTGGDLLSGDSRPAGLLMAWAPLLLIIILLILLIILLILLIILLILIIILLILLIMVSILELRSLILLLQLQPTEMEICGGTICNWLGVRALVVRALRTFISNTH